MSTLERLLEVVSDNRDTLKRVPTGSSEGIGAQTTRPFARRDHVPPSGVTLGEAISTRVHSVMTRWPAPRRSCARVR